MTLVVRTPPGREAERRYVLDVVLGRWWGLDWRHEVADRPDVRITAADDPDGGAVTLPDALFGTPDDMWLTPWTLPEPTHWARAEVDGAGVLGAGERLPVLYGEAPLIRLGPGSARLGVDVLGAAFVLLTRYEELAVATRDAHDRFPSAASLAGRGGFLHLPVADAYAELLWTACTRVWPRLARRERAYEVLLTHDVDDPLSTIGRNGPRLARQFVGDVVRRRDAGLLARRARAVLAGGPDPHDTFDLLMDVSDRHGLRSAFYFLPQHDVDPDAAPYQLFDHPWVRELIGRVHRRGHEVGLHAGFGTYRDAERTAEEHARLRAIAEAQGVTQERWGGRQHYLQWANPTTWRNWDRAGLDYDCTLGFADAVGFRTGTCHDYPAFDLLERRTLDLHERPFQVMDVALAGDAPRVPDTARDTVLALARTVRRFGGALGVLWHNDELLRTTREKRWYEALVGAITNP